MGPLQSFEDLVGFLLRRRWIILAAMLMATVLGAFYAMQRPHRYTAFTSIEVQSAQVTGTTPANERVTEPGREAAQMLQTVRHRLTTRDSLLALGERYAIFSDAPALSPDQRISLLRMAISIDTILGNDGGWSGSAPITAIVISFTWDDAELTARVANDLAQQLMDMSASGQIRQARDTFEFFNEKRKAAELEILEQEDRIATYRSENAASLPPATSALRDELVVISAELRGLDGQLLTVNEEHRRLSARETLRPTDRQRLRELDDQILLLSEQKEAMELRRSASETRLAGVPEVERGLADLERRLEQSRRDFDNANISLSTAESALQLAETQQRERFAVLDQATTPENPSGTSRRMYVMAAAVAGAIGGVLLGFALELMRPVIRTSAQLQRELGIRPLIAIPPLELNGKRKRRFWKRHAAG